MSTMAHRIQAIRALSIAQSIQLYLQHGVKASAAHTPQAMLAAAGEITGNDYAEDDLALALDDLQAWRAA